MPYYDYQCQNEECGHRFEARLSIANRKLPEDEPCPECGGKVLQTIGAAKTVSGVAIRDKKPDHFRDKLKDMKKTAGRGHTLDRVL